MHLNIMNYQVLKSTDGIETEKKSQGFDSAGWSLASVRLYSA